MNKIANSETTYSVQEERLNILSHQLGVVLSIVALVLMLVKTLPLGGLHIASAIIFGTSLIALYTASSLYHSETDALKRLRLRTLDHSAIFVLIAGTYTPVALITLNGKLGWQVFWLAWGIAILGIGLKLFFTGRFKKTSTVLYVTMGWIILFVGDALKKSIAPEGLDWLLGGGGAYTLGAILYSIKRLPFNHAIFHCFVLAGSSCHFIAIYCYVL